ncbi:MAG: hypothetical protein ACXWTP_02245 [Methylosarcina sp.]
MYTSDFSLLEFFKIVPGLVIFPLSFYIAWKKLGVKVSASYSMHSERTLASRIGSIVLNNHKDRSVTIFAIYALINRDISYEVEKFDPPLILKALESVAIETGPYSRLHVDGEVYEPKLGEHNLTELYLVLSDRILRCEMESPPSIRQFIHFNTYRVATKETRTFNGLVYNDEAAYAIIYKMNGEVQTAIVDDKGFICRGWNYRINKIPVNAMSDKSTVREYLELAQFNKVSEWFVINDLRRV